MKYTCHKRPEHYRERTGFDVIFRGQWVLGTVVIKGIAGLATRVPAYMQPVC